jgi:hypothetical protein
MFEALAVLVMYISAILAALLEYIPDALVALVEFAYVILTPLVEHLSNNSRSPILLSSKAVGKRPVFPKSLNCQNDFLYHRRP